MPTITITYPELDGLPDYVAHVAARLAAGETSGHSGVDHHWTSTPPAPRVEVLIERDPDAGTDIALFVDGVQVEADVEADVDPGAGYHRTDWDERTAAARAEEGCSAAFREALVATLERHAGSEYIVDDRS